MILYIVKTSSKTKVFECEKKLNTFLTNEQINGKNINHYSISTYESELKSVSNGLECSNNYSSSITRDNKLDAALGDDYASNVQKFKQLITEFGKPGPQKEAFLLKLDITPAVKADMIHLIKSNSSFTLYEFPLILDDSVEYYKLLLKLYNFRKIEDRFVRETYNKSGHIHSRGYCVTPERCLTGFKLAKES